MKIKKIAISAAAAAALCAGCGKKMQMSVIGEEAAKKLALAEAGLTAKEAKAVSSGLLTRDGVDYYRVDVTAPDGSYQYDIDALTCVVIDSRLPSETEMLTADEETYTTQASDNGGKLTQQQARELAFSQVPGAGQADLYEFKVDIDDGRMLYEGEIIYNGMEYDFEIDAYSGAIRSWDSEPLD